MSSKNKRTLIIVLFLDLLILLVIAFFLFKPQFFKNRKHDVEFSFTNPEEVTSEVAVGIDKFEPAKLSVTLDGQDVSNLLQYDDSKLDLTKLGTYDVIYYIVYDEKRYEQIQTINVVDKVSPSLTLTGKKITILLKEKYNEPGFKATDNYDGDLTNKVEVENKVDNTKAGTYEITYKVSDSSGNTAEATREVVVKKPNTIVAVPKDEVKVAIPKVNETGYANTIKKNKFTTSSVILDGYLKEPAEENKIRLVGNETIEIPVNISNNNYQLTINISEIPDGTYKMYIDELPLLNKMAEIERLARAKVGSKLVTFTYNNDEVTMKIEPHSYSYDILINPGHGSDDSGAVNEYITEKEMNLKVSMYEKCRYEAHGLRVYMTRTNDTYSRNFGPSSAIRLHKLAYEMGYYGAVSKIVYSNHHNSIGNNYYMGYEILVAGELTQSELANELAIANKWNSIYTFTENHLRFYARDYDTEIKYSKLNGEVYSFKNNYAVNRIPLAVSNVKSIIYEGCYMSNKNDFNWYWQSENWHRVSEAKIEVYVKSLGIGYNADNSSCL